MDSPLEEKLGAILSNPDMMQKIQSLAQSLGQPETQSKSTEAPTVPQIDPPMVQKLAAMAG